MLSKPSDSVEKDHAAEDQTRDLVSDARVSLRDYVFVVTGSVLLSLTVGAVVWS